MKHQINLAAIVAMALGSCITYKEAPVDLAHDTAEWAAISSAVCKGNRLSKEQMLQTGLLLNRELNQARLKAAKSTSVAEFSGLWADPTVSFEIERVFGENITNSALAPGLTLPVTGLPALAKKIAEQYKEADYWRMKVAEQNYMTELECLRHRIMVTHEKLRVIQARLSVASAEHKQIARLHQLGEIDFGAFQVAAQRLNDTEEAEKELDIEHTRLRNELIEKLGLHPIVGVIELSGALPESVPGKVSVPTADALLKSPSLMVLQAEYGASENELRAKSENNIRNWAFPPVMQEMTAMTSFPSAFLFLFQYGIVTAKPLRERMATVPSSKLNSFPNGVIYCSSLRLSMRSRLC